MRWLAFFCLLALVVSQVTACSRDGDATPAPGQTASAASPTPVAQQLTLPPDAERSLDALATHSQMFRFGHLTTDMGLSQSVVTDLLQDDQGFLWLATQDGLNRYDGSEFQVFKDDHDTPNSLRGNLVAALAKAPTGEIWIGTNDGGLSCYNPHTGQFTSYLHDPQDPNSLSENSVPAVDVDAQGIVWAGTNNSGLNRLDPSTGQITRYLHDPNDPASLGADLVSTVLAAPDGQVWVGAIGGTLNRLDPATGRFTRYQHDPNNPRSLSNSAVQSLYVDSEGTLWVGTFTAGLSRYDTQADGFVHYPPDPQAANRLGHHSVSCTFEDSMGHFWVGTQSGLYLMDRQTGNFTRYGHDPDNPNSLNSDAILSIYEDTSGTVWFGLFGTGADYYDPYRNKFLLLRPEPGNPNSLSNASLWGIYKDREGILWVGTHGDGLNRFDPQTGEWRHYRHDPNDPATLDNNIVYTAYQDSAGTYWFGTPTALHRFDPQTETFQRYPGAPIMAMYEDRQGNFWLGSAVGLLLLDRDTMITTEIFRTDPHDPSSLSSDSVDALLEDDQGRFWVGTLNGGLNLLDRESGRFTRFVRDPQDPHSISSNVVLAIHQAQDGTLWVGTSVGLNKLDPQTGAFTAYREAEGLPSDFVYGILEDEQGHLWLSTNKGISDFDPTTETLRNYDQTDGLQANEFNQWSFFQDEAGLMYFGGVSGLNAFHPAQVRDNPFVPPVALTGFEIYRQPVVAGPGSPLQQPIEATQEITLTYRDDFFEFRYAALHFSSPDEIRYAYKMEELDKGWNEVGNRRFANYTNVPPGEYVFRVKGTNSDGLWNEQGIALRIHIPPPFWQTWLFRVAVFACSVGAFSGAFLWRLRAAERRGLQLEAQVKERTHELTETMLELERSKEAAEAASRAKSVFLANMSHEFRTPLNAILGFTQIMTRDRRLSPDQQEDIGIVLRSSEHLLGLINDVLEMSKIEAGRTTLGLRGFDLHRMLDGLQEMFALRAERKGIALLLDLAPDVPQYVRADEGKLRQVLMNLLGNAVKFTEQGQVVLRVYPCNPPPGEGLWVCFSVEDTGPGIAPEEQAQLFVPFVQTRSGRQAQEGTGLGLAISQQYVRLMGSEIRVNSEPGRGSVFQFAVPLTVVDVNDLEKPPSTHQVVGLEPGQPVYRLLVVDDQEVNRKLMLKLFRPLGFEVREAANGQEALEVWESWEPHLIWMDMRMPVMDGYEATRRIKATTRGMATIIIALTASALDEDRAVILSEGCDDYMRKPFREEEMFEVVAKHLGVRYVYQDMTPTPAQEPTPSDQEEPTAWLAARLRAADPAWLADLERATTLGDLEAIERLAGQVAEQDSALAEELARLADGFEHDRILVAIAQSHDSEEHEPNGRS